MKCTFIISSICVVLIGIVMAALFPAGSNPLVAKKTRMAMQGRNVYWLLYESCARQGEKAFSECFESCSNSTDFVLQMAEYVKGEDLEFWRSLVDGEGCCWSVLSSPTGLVDCDAPMLMSANINPRLLSAKKDLIDKEMPLGVSAGASRSLLNDKVAVIVRRNGTVQTLGKKYCTTRNIIGTALNHASKICFICLTPKDRINVVLQ